MERLSDVFSQRERDSNSMDNYVEVASHVEDPLFEKVLEDAEYEGVISGHAADQIWDEYENGDVRKAWDMLYDGLEGQ